MVSDDIVTEVASEPDSSEPVNEKGETCCSETHDIRTVEEHQPEPDITGGAAVEPQPATPVVDRILTEVQREQVEATRRMKDLKIDEFIDKSMSGEVDETVCDNIVSFLKVDIDICDALLGMDYTSLDSILDGFRKILSIIDEAPEPHSQSVYSNSLSPEQSVIEYHYNKVIEHIQDIMLRRYANML